MSHWESLLRKASGTNRHRQVATPEARWGRQNWDPVLQKYQVHSVTHQTLPLQLKEFLVLVFFGTFVSCKDADLWICSEGAELPLESVTVGNSLLVQWLGLNALTAEGLGSIPSQGTKIPQATWHKQRKRKYHCGIYCPLSPCRVCKFKGDMSSPLHCHKLGWPQAFIILHKELLLIEALQRKMGPYSEVTPIHWSWFLALIWAMARSFRCLEVFSILKAECLQSWLLGTPEGIGARVKPGWSVLGILSLGKLDKLGTFWAEDSGQGFRAEIAEKVLAIGRQTPLTTASSPSPVSSRPSYMFRYLILLPFRSPDLSESLYSKDRFWS